MLLNLDPGCSWVFPMQSIKRAREWDHDFTKCISFTAHRSYLLHGLIDHGQRSKTWVAGGPQYQNKT